MTRSPRFRVFCVVGLLAPAALDGQVVPPASAPALSLPEAVALARTQNPTYLQQRNDVGVARWTVRSAYADFLPSASVGTSFGYQAAGQRRVGSVEFGEQPAIYSSGYNLGLQLDVSGAKLLRPSIAKSQARETVLQVEGTEANLTADVTQQYLSVLQAEAAVEQAEREVARTEEYVRLAQTRLEVGTGTPLDVRRAEVQRGQAEVRLVQARNSVATATLQLGQLLGAPLEPETRLTSEFPLFEPDLNPDALVAVAVRNNPNLLAARATLDAARTGVRAARTAYLPTLSLSAGLQGYASQFGSVDPLVQQQIGGLRDAFGQCVGFNEIRTAAGLPVKSCSTLDPSDPQIVAGIRDQIEARNSGFPFGYIRQPFTASLVVSLPIFTGLSRQLQIEQQEAQASDARQRVRAEELRLRADVATVVRNVETAYRTAVLQERVRSASAEELRLAQERFRYGLANSVEVTDAQTNLAEAERALIDATYSFHQSLAALEALVGEPLLGSALIPTTNNDR